MKNYLFLLPVLTVLSAEAPRAEESGAAVVENKNIAETDHQKSSEMPSVETKNVTASGGGFFDPRRRPRFKEGSTPDLRSEPQNSVE
jgi:hypothetical protein